MAEQLWWVHLGYPPFEAQRQHATDQLFPRPGQVVKYYREHTIKDTGTRWTQSDLALVLGITTKAVNEMENKDKGLDSIARRRFLMQTFNIPPVLFGFVALDDLLSHLPPLPDAPLTTARSMSVDLTQYEAYITEVWDAYYRGPTSVLLAATETQMDLLYRALPFASGAEAERIKAILAEFHITLSAILRDLYQLGKAAQHASLAVALTRECADREGYADALYTRGMAYVAQAEFLQEKPDLRIQTLRQAANDYEVALSEQYALGLHQRSDIALQAGKVAALTATSYAERKAATKRIDALSSLLARAEREEDPLFYRFLASHYHIDRGAALVGAGWLSEGHDAFMLIDTSHDTRDVRQAARANTLLAQLYLADKDYPAALGALDATLPDAIAAQSDININKIIQIYRSIVSSPFGKNPEVARFGALLGGYSRKGRQ